MAYQNQIPNITVSKGGVGGAIGSAFGGWIYNFSYELGNSQTPGSVSLSIALDSQTGGSNPDFAISHSDLQAYAGAEWAVAFGGKIFEKLYLISYDIKGDGDSKTLKVVFKDFGIVLDKIHVALFKRHDYDKTLAQTLAANVTVNAVCPDCSLGAGMVQKTQSVYREIQTANYFFKNQTRTSIFRPAITQSNSITVPFPTSSTPPPAPRYDYINGVISSISNAPTIPKHVLLPRLKSLPPLIVYGYGFFSAKRVELAKDYFIDPLIPGVTTVGSADVDGGTIVLGTEEFNEKECSSLPSVSYNFLELVMGMINAGLRIRYKTSNNVLSSEKNSYASALHPEIVKNQDYLNNYHGTLRSVLNNWCSDFGIDFYIKDDTLVFYNLNKVKADFINEDMHRLAVPTSAIGASFNSNTDTAITNYEESCSIDNNYASSLVVADLRPRNVIRENKTVHRKGLFSSLHPLDFLYGVVTPVNYNATMHWWDRRYLALTDRCAAIGRYNADLRDIYAAIEISQNPNAANNQFYNSFAFHPYVILNEANDNLTKQAFINHFTEFKDADGKELSQNYFNDSKFFEVIIGVRSEEQALEILEWEALIAENMYKYGLLVNGNISAYPYLSSDFVDSPAQGAGLFDSAGLKVLKVKNDTTPESKRYFDGAEFPLKDLFKSDTESRFYFSTNNAGYIADLTNEWGTNVAEFNKRIAINAAGNCNNFGQLNSVNNTSIELQHFKLNDFKPTFHDLDNDFVRLLESHFKTIKKNNPAAFDILQGLLERKNPTSSTSTTLCPKLQVMIVPKVVGGNSAVNHPNCQVIFAAGSATNFVMSRKKIKYEQDFLREKRKQFPKTICDVDLVKSVCNTACSDPDIYEDLSFRLGFQNFLARSIDITVVSNPFTSIYTAGSNDFTLSNGKTKVKNAKVNEDFPIFQVISKTAKIVYPINGDYNALITHNVEVETRSPELIKIKNKLWDGKPNINAVKIEFINEEITQDVQNLILDPSLNGQLIKPVFDRRSGRLNTLEDYFNLIKNIQDESNKTDETISCTIEVAGNIMDILGSGHVLLDQSLGFLKSLSLTMTQSGFISRVTVSSAGNKTPKKETFLNYRSSRVR